MGRILGVLCLSGLRFFLGSLFFGEKHLYILLCFHQFLHLIPCLAIGWISSFLLRKQCRVFRVQFFYLWQLFQSSFIKSGFSFAVSNRKTYKIDAGIRAICRNFARHSSAIQPLNHSTASTMSVPAVMSRKQPNSAANRIKNCVHSQQYSV